MSDPYRHNPAYDYPATTTTTYNPTQYAPADQYAGALTTRHGSTSSTYYPSQSNMQLSQSSYRPPSSSDYLDPNRAHSTHHHHKSRSHSRHGRSDDDHDRARSRSRSRSKSRSAEWGATLAGAAAGGLLGHKAGHGSNMKTVGGIIAGAVGAHELERGYEKRRERKRAEEGDPYARDGGDRQHGRRRRSSGGGLFDGVREKVEGLLSPGGDEREREGKRRARSHVEERRRRRSGGGGREGYSSDEEDYERYERRRSGGGRKGRDDY